MWRNKKGNTQLWRTLSNQIWIKILVPNNLLEKYKNQRNMLKNKTYRNIYQKKIELLILQNKWPLIRKNKLHGKKEIRETYSFKDKKLINQGVNILCPVGILIHTSYDASGEYV